MELKTYIPVYPKQGRRNDTSNHRYPSVTQNEGEKNDTSGHRYLIMLLIVTNTITIKLLVTP